MNVYRRFFALTKTERKIHYATASVPAGAVVAVWKIVLTCIAPSLFLLSNVIYAIGVILAKILAIRTHHQSGALTSGAQAHDLQRRTYRIIGLVIFLLSLAYTALATLALVQGGAGELYSLPVALAIAASTFAELTISIVGFIVARRDHELVVEAIRLVNVAGSLILLVLTQTALLSLGEGVDSTGYNRIFGIVLGSLAAAIGLYMTLRPLPSSPCSVKRRDPLGQTRRGVDISRQISTTANELHAAIHRDDPHPSGRGNCRYQAE